jgi:cyclase
MRKIFFAMSIMLVFMITAAVIIYDPANQAVIQNESITIDPGLVLVFGGGGNSGIVIGDSAAIVIDTKMMGSSEELYKLAKEKTGTKPLIVINTHYHRDHTSGNKYYKGSRILIGNYEKDFLLKNIDSENQPTDFVKDSLLIDLGNEKVHLYNLGRAHTYDDMVVYLSNRNILFTGDLIFNHTNPVLVEESGTRVQDWIKKLGIILEYWSGSKIVPGHGKIGDKEMVQSMRQYFIDMTDAVENPDKEKQLIEKYADWAKISGRTSPENTIAFIKKTEAK